LKGGQKPDADSVDFPTLAKLLNKVKGKVILSGTEAEASFFPKWRHVKREYTGRCRTGAHKQVSKQYKEYLYFNFPEKKHPTHPLAPFEHDWIRDSD